MAASIATGIWLSLQKAARKGLPTDAVTDLVVWVILGGIVGARLLHVVDRWDTYAADPLRILAIQGGGLAIQGVILDGVLTGAVLT